MFTWPKSRFYGLSAVTLWVLFLASIFGLEWGRHTGMPMHLIWVLSAVPGITVIIQFILAYQLIARQDEFARGVTAKRMIVAGGITLALVTGWSVAEQYANVPAIPMWLAYPLFWSFFAIVTPIVSDSLH